MLVFRPDMLSVLLRTPSSLRSHSVQAMCLFLPPRAELAAAILAFLRRSHVWLKSDSRSMVDRLRLFLSGLWNTYRGKPWELMKDGDPWKVLECLGRSCGSTATYISTSDCSAPMFSLTCSLAVALGGIPSKLEHFRSNKDTCSRRHLRSS